jgi:hypothetical protein
MAVPILPIKARHTITIAGQTFDGSQDGKPIGIRYGEFIISQNGTFEVSVGPTSAFLLTLKNRDRDDDRERDDH